VEKRRRGKSGSRRGDYPLAGKGAVPGVPPELARSPGTVPRRRAGEFDPDASAAAAAAAEAGLMDEAGGDEGPASAPSGRLASSTENDALPPRRP
jgi:hypothetical protein